MDLIKAKAFVEHLLQNKEYKFVLSALKGLRNGAVYGVRIRAPHALVMIFLFGKGTKVHREIKALIIAYIFFSSLLKLQQSGFAPLYSAQQLVEKLFTIVKLTRTHAQNLSKFVFSYKLVTGWLAKLLQGKQQWHSFIVASLVGYFVFGDYNGVNMQINLYLLSRITAGLARLAVEKKFIPEPNFPVFPWFAAFVWGVVLWLFEYHKAHLQPSLQNSMTYLYTDSNYWTCLKDFLFVNKLD